MATVKRGVVSQAHARSRSGPTIGRRVATSGTTIYIDLSAFENQYVRIRAVTEDIYFAFGPNNSFTLDSATNSEMEDYCADILVAGTSDEFTVPVGSTWLAVESVSDDPGLVLVFPS